MGYKALEEFPAVDGLLQSDYRLIKDPEKFAESCRKVNEIFEGIGNGSLQGGDIPQTLIQVGVLERCFYVLGFRMSSAIDEELGRDAFKECVIKGPRDFIRTYNSLADDGRRVVDLYAGSQ